MWVMLVNILAQLPPSDESLDLIIELKAIFDLMVEVLVILIVRP